MHQAAHRTKEVGAGRGRTYHRHVRGHRVPLRDYADGRAPARPRPGSAVDGPVLREDPLLPGESGASGTDTISTAGHHRTARPQLAAA